MNTAINIGAALRLPQLDRDLAVVETELLQSVTSDDAFLTDVASHLIKAGGKRLRPALTLASAIASTADAGEPRRTGGSSGKGTLHSAGRDVIRGSCAVELVHLGSLYHDDVIDEAATRRGVPTVNAKWDNLIAIVSGDFLLARASEIAASLGTEVASLLAATIARLCEGELQEIRTAFQVSRDESSYIAAIAGKTASLLATSCRVGALTAGAPRAAVDTLTEFGQAFGMVFQIVDDINDLVLAEEELGKPAGDLRCGVYNLPVIRALALPEVGDELRGLLGGVIAPPEADKARTIIRASGAIEAAVLVGRSFADQAQAAVEPLRGAGSADDVLDGLAELGHRLLDGVPV